MHPTLRSTLLVVALLATAGAPPLADGLERGAALRSYEEVPAVSTLATGQLRLTSIAPTSITYELSWADLQGAVSQAHLHFAQPGVNGGIVIFLCTNLGNGPVGTQACPATNPAQIAGTIATADVIGSAASQGIAAGDLAEVLRALDVGMIYVNVHSALFPVGEIRGQIRGLLRR